MSALGSDFQRLHNHLTAAEAAHPGDTSIQAALVIVTRYLDGAVNGYADPPNVPAMGDMAPGQPSGLDNPTCGQPAWHHEQFYCVKGCTWWEGDDEDDTAAP